MAETAAGGAVPDLVLEAAPLFSIPGRTPEFSWRAPGDVDRATDGAAARRLYLAPPLHEAARTGSAADVAAMLDGGADVDELDGGGHTPLHFAAGFERVDVTELLLARGAALETRDKWGKAPVDWALQAHADATVKLLRAAAVERGVTSGRGDVAPLATMTEHFHKMTDEEMRVELAKVAAEVAERAAAMEARDAAAPLSGVTENLIRYDAAALRARLAASHALAAAAVAPAAP